MTVAPPDAVRILLRRPAAFRRYPSYMQQLQRLDELAQRHADLIHREELGTSSGERPIISYTIGGGRSRALWYGGPHANEVVGAATTIYLLERLQARIDDMRPRFLFGLYNHELGRPVCFLSGSAPWLAEPLTTLLLEMQFRPETANIIDLADRPLSPGVFAMPARTRAYEALHSRLSALSSSGEI